jgi:nucleoside-triphosphatase
VPLLLLTGAPGSGKSTVMRGVAAALAGRNVRGFFTAELREGGRRTGFAVESLAGARGTLARAGLASPHRVGRYGVDVLGFERVALPALAPGAAAYLVDEIGPMECFSGRFVAAVRALLAADARVVATVHRRAGGFAGELRSRPGAILLEVTPGNRDGLPSRVARWIGEGPGNPAVR